MWWTWARIAIRCTDAAGQARKNGAPAWKYEAAESAALSAEFEWSISAITACAFAMEALSKELDEGGRKVDKSNLKPGRKVSKGYYVGHHIVQVFGVPDPPASNLIDRLEQRLGRFLPSN
jgi:hypothetical protein